MGISIFFLSLFILGRAVERTFPRGVLISQGSLYNPLEDFTCFDGTLRLPFLFVNDDYCDCPDGSDEPGTSACPNGHYHCENVGFVSRIIPTSRVNDGVCDCCDGSDEYISGNCSNICNILGAAAKRIAEEEALMLSQGNELRMQMILAGKQIKQQKQERLDTLESEKLEAIKLKDEAAHLKQVAESAENDALAIYKEKQEELKKAEEEYEKEQNEQEAKNVFNELDVNGDGLLQRNEIIVKEALDRDKDGQISDEELMLHFQIVGEIPLTIFVDMWPKIKTYLVEEDAEEVKDKNEEEEESIPERADMYTRIIENPEDQPELNVEQTNEHWDPSDLKNLEENTENVGNVQEEELEEEEEVEYKTENYSEGEESLKSEDQYDENTMKLIEEANKARSRYEDAERTLQDLERELTRLKDSLEKDYGPEEEFIPLDGQCYSYSDREYVYKLCPFDQVVQMGKSGGSETRLGVWSGWEGDKEYNTMIYDKGQACWNGPQRSTRVTLVCGLETAVTGASEPNKCEYELTLTTPAACRYFVRYSPDSSHDEL